MTHPQQALAGRRVRRALSKLLDSQPFFGSMVLQMPIEAGGTETLAANGKNIRFAPAWVAGQELDTVESAIARVTLACALKHHLRREERKPDIWQQASVAVTNPILRDAGLPVSGSPDRDIADMPIEKAYEMLLQMQQQQQQQQRGPQPSGGYGLSRSRRRDGSPSDPGGDGEIQDWPGSDSADDGDGDDGEQSQAGGDAGSDPGDGESESDAGGERKPSESEMQSEAQRWDEIASQSMVYHRAERPGKDPGKIAGKIAAQFRRCHDWRAELIRFASSTARTDYSWSRPNRRYIHSGIFLPDLHGTAMGQIVLAIDTSGSVDEETLARFWAEIRAVAEDLRPSSVRIIQCDAEVTADERFDCDALPDTIEVKGRGGTRFSPVFQRIAERSPDGKPECLLFFTDLHCTDFGDEPDFPVLWATPETDERHYFRPSTPPFGESLRIPKE